MQNSYGKTGNLGRALALPGLFSVLALLSPLQAAVAAGPTDVGSDATGEPSVSVTALRSERGAMPRHVDEHSVTQVFWVSSQASVLNLSCVLSDLVIQGTAQSDAYRASSQSLRPSTERGCYIEVPGAVAVIGGGHLKIAELDEGKRSAEGLRSNYVTFRSIDGAAFEQDVYVTAYWRQHSAMQLSGKYEGAIKLEARIPDEQEPAR